MRVAVVQKPPVLLDRERTIASAVASVHEAAEGGAKLVVFPEAFVPGYPVWIWRLRAGDDAALARELHVKLLDNAVRLECDDLAPLRDAARERAVTIVCGIDERDAEFSRTTIYNTMVTIGADGAIANRHRKLMPTNAERMVWGFGDASGVKPVDTPCGRVGGLICWENYMPLPRYALYAQGIDVYVAPTYDEGESWIATMRHIAKEGGCWVVGSGFALRARDIPDATPGKSRLFENPDEWVNPGDSVVVEPGGRIVAGPLHEAYAILYADIDLARVAMSRRTLDVVGHYARPDVFRLHVDTKRQPPVEFE